jgi:hypothetical protein
MSSIDLSKDTWTRPAEFPRPPTGSASRTSSSPTTSSVPAASTPRCSAARRSSRVSRETENRCYIRDGTRIRYAESSEPAEETILLTSPWPESVYAVAPIWSLLAQRVRLFAVDLPGFGGSERRDDLMSPRAMGEFLVRLIDERGLGHPHIVGPDIWTSAALFAAASRPGLLSSVVVGSGGRPSRSS